MAQSEWSLFTHFCCFLIRPAGRTIIHEWLQDHAVDLFRSLLTNDESLMQSIAQHLNSEMSSSLGVKRRLVDGGIAATANRFPLSEQSHAPPSPSESPSTGLTDESSEPDPRSLLASKFKQRFDASRSSHAMDDEERKPLSIPSRASSRVEMSSRSPFVSYPVSDSILTTLSLL